MEKLIEISNVTKRFGKTVALDGISMNIGEGITGLVGPNGAGKTTLINIIAGLLTPDSGYIKIVTGKEDFRWDLGVIRDKISLPPEVDVEFFLEKVGEIYNTPKNKVNYIIKNLGLEMVKHKKVGALSLGYKKRVGIAQAVLHDPIMVLADEPFTQLDPLIKVDIRDAIGRLSRDEGTNFFISSHEIADLEMLVDKTFLIDNGKIVREIKKGERTSLLVRCDNANNLREYLIKYGIRGKIEGRQLRVEIKDLKNALKILGNYEGKIYSVNMASIEGVMKDELENS